MISKDKQYRTRDGREVRIYATDGNPPHSVHGAFFFEGEWHCTCWKKDGTVFCSGKDASSFTDLIEIRPRIKRELWCNVYKDSWVYSDVEDYLFETKEEADKSAGSNRFACVKVVIDCEEGEGL